MTHTSTSTSRVNAVRSGAATIVVAYHVAACGLEPGSVIIP